MFEIITLCAASAYLLFVGLFLETSNIRSLIIFKFTPIVIAMILAYISTEMWRVLEQVPS